MNENLQLMAVSKVRRQRAQVSKNRCSLRTIAISTLAIFGCVAICSTDVLAAPVIYVNGTQTSITGVVRDNQIFVPVHGIFEKLNTTLRVTPARTVIAHKGSADIARLAVASRQATVNGAPRMLATAPFMYNSTPYVPLRLLSEAAGASVVYARDTHAVSINAASVAKAAPVTAAAQVATAATTTTTESAAVAPVAQEHGIPWWVWLLLALVVLALLLAFLRRRKPDPIIKTRSGSSDLIIKTRR